MRIYIQLAGVGEEIDCQLGLATPAPVTLDLDSSDTEVYGRLAEGAAFNHQHPAGGQHPRGPGQADASYRAARA